MALFCGVLIGLQREMGKAGRLEEPVLSGPPAPRGRAAVNPAGIRTHAMVSVFGALMRLLDLEVASTWTFTLAGLAATTFLAGAIYAVRGAKTGRYGATSVFTMAVTYSLGAMAMTDLSLVAGASAVIVTAILTYKAPLHRFVRKLAPEEIQAAVKLGLVALVALPALPNRAFGPRDWPLLGDALQRAGVSEEALDALRVVNPFQLWFFVVAISGIGFVGYVLVRAIGASRGLPLAGLVGGLVSSTAVTFSVAQQSKSAARANAAPFAAAILAACFVMSLRVIAIVAAAGPRLVPQVAMAMLPAAAVTGVAAWRLARGARAGGADSASAVGVKTPFALGPALKLTAVYFAVRVVSKVLTLLIGGAGLIVTAVFAGLVDVDAVTLSSAQESGGDKGGVSLQLAAAAILTAVASNTLVKSGTVFAIGSRAVARTVAVWLGASLGAGLAGLLLGRAFV